MADHVSSLSRDLSQMLGGVEVGGESISDAASTIAGFNPMDLDDVDEEAEQVQGKRRKVCKVFGVAKQACHRSPNLCASGPTRPSSMLG